MSFIDPCCDDIPVRLFGKIMEAISNVEQEWNCRIANKVNSLPPNITIENQHSNKNRNEENGQDFNSERR